MGGLDDPEATGREPPSSDLLATWWERVLAGVAVALLMAFGLDIIIYH
jgi:hypothetical protein